MIALRRTLRPFEQSQLRFGVGDAFGDVEQRILLDILIAPLNPTRTAEPREQLQIWPRRARLDQIVNLVGLAGVLPLAA